MHATYHVGEQLLTVAEPVEQYLRSFQWNKVKYRADKPIADLIDSLQKVCHDIRVKLVEYS